MYNDKLNSIKKLRNYSQHKLTYQRSKGKLSVRWTLNTHTLNKNFNMQVHSGICRQTKLNLAV